MVDENEEREIASGESILEGHLAIVRAAIEILPLVGEMNDGRFVPLPHPSLTDSVRDEIQPWIFEPWRKLLDAVTELYGPQDCDDKTSRRYQAIRVRAGYEAEK
jgi:hypothetical protein